MFGTLAHVLVRLIMLILNVISVISCDEIIDLFDTVLVNLNDKKVTCKMGNYYILLTSLLVTILLLIINIFYYCTKHAAKQKEKLPYS